MTGNDLMMQGRSLFSSIPCPGEDQKTQATQKVRSMCVDADLILDILGLKPKEPTND